jgi:thioredoxin reductase (NADPH)
MISSSIKPFVLTRDFYRIRSLAKSYHNNSSKNIFEIFNQNKTGVKPLQNEYEYDLAVIGGGSGGLACAKEAARHGAKVVLFDYVKPSTQNTSWGLGGTCVNVGCVPKKLMHYTALIGSMKKDGEYFGWNSTSKEREDATFNWEKLVKNIGNHIRSLNFSYGSSLTNANVEYINAEAKFKDTNTIVYAPPKKLDLFSSTKNNDGDEDKENLSSVTEEINAKYIVIAVGGRPHIPEDVPGALEYSISSDDIFWRKEKAPGKTLCVGGGYISLECAGFLNEFGYDTSVAVRSKILRTFDDDCADKIKDLMGSIGVTFLSGKVPKKIIPLKSDDDADSDSKLKVIFNDNDEEIYDTVLYATGRVADTKNLGLENVNINISNDVNGKISTNEYDQTAVENIFAIGDVVENKPELTPVAIQAGELLAKRLFTAKKSDGSKHTMKMDYDFIPTTIFTPFEYGTVGFSEKDAILKYGGEEHVESYLWSWTTLELEASKRLKHGAADDLDVIPPNCFAKLVCVGENERVVGFHFVGPNAGEVTQGFSLALRLGACKYDFDRLVGIHPTDAEAFTAMEVKRSEIKSKDDYVAVGGCGGGKCG